MEEQRTFSGALARLLGLIVAIILLILAVWFVIRLFNDVSDSGDESGTVATVDDDTASVIDKRLEGTTVVVGENDGNLTAATEEELEQTSASASSEASSSTSGAQVASATDELPNTGPGEFLLSAFSIVLLVQMYRTMQRSRKKLIV